MIVSEIKGSVLDAKTDYLAHQCNCNTVKAHGFSDVLFKKYPWANVYESRSKMGNRNRTSEPSIPGTVQISSSTNKGFPGIIHMFGQWSPGKPGSFSFAYPSETYKDTREDRVNYFRSCIQHMEQFVKDDEIVAVPSRIGCGLAGGDWKVYRSILDQSKIQFVVYELVSNEA